ncbi:pseudouridine synthase [Scenedesmus sp. NREL 46B-D3]|nr:pseudouridine synthase [Scenedesmus sp. NREL 46B-D3]
MQQLAGPTAPVLVPAPDTCTRCRLACLPLSHRPRCVAAAAGSVQGKVRLDAYLASRLPGASRAKISASIRAGLVLVNAAAATKPAQAVRGGDRVDVSLLPPEPCTAIPEAIPLHVVYEDEHLIVVNKAAGMVVHLSPGHSTGTLVNALLAHCGLPPCTVACGNDDGDDDDDDGGGRSSNTEVAASHGSSSSSSSRGIIRPGIVHRLDRGTSGLMVVAKTDFCHAALCSQFKERSVSRIYNAIVTGLPSPAAARVATNVSRDPGNRLRMMAVPYGSGRGRTAVSNYQTLQVLASSGAALVQWKLETGRTHQIRVHARHIGHPLLGDDLYGPGHAAAARTVVGKRSSLLPTARAAVEGFARPALHAKTLGFTHPVTQQRLAFDSEWPQDFHSCTSSCRTGNELLGMERLRCGMCRDVIRRPLCRAQSSLSADMLDCPLRFVAGCMGSLLVGNGCTCLHATYLNALIAPGACA